MTIATTPLWFWVAATPQHAVFAAEATHPTVRRERRPIWLDLAQTQSGRRPRVRRDLWPATERLTLTGCRRIGLARSPGPGVSNSMCPALSCRGLNVEAVWSRDPAGGGWLRRTSRQMTCCTAHWQKALRRWHECDQYAGHVNAHT